jgi:hypothetical protein
MPDTIDTRPAEPRPHSRPADLERVKQLLKELAPDAEPFDRLKVLFAVIDYGTTCALDQWKRDSSSVTKQGGKGD